MHDPETAQETEVKVATSPGGSPAGTGGCTTIHLRALFTSINGASVVEDLRYEPTATHDVEEAQDTDAMDSPARVRKDCAVDAVHLEAAAADVAPAPSATQVPSTERASDLALVLRDRRLWPVLPIDAPSCLVSVLPRTLRIVSIRILKSVRVTSPTRPVPQSEPWCYRPERPK